MSQDAAGSPSPEYPSPAYQNTPGVWPPPPLSQPDNGWGSLMPPFNETGLLARWVAGLLIGNIVFDVLGMIIDPLRSSSGQIASSLLSGLQSLLLLVTGIVFFVWTYRSYKNLTAFGATGLRMTPGWVIAYFFIPVLNLFRAYSAYKEIWQVSTPGLPLGDDRGWKSAPSAPIILGWWLFWLLKNITDEVVAFSAQDGNAGAVNVWLNEGGHVVGVAAAACAILVVRRITARQAAKWKEVVAGRAATVPPPGYPVPGAAWAG